MSVIILIIHLVVDGLFGYAVLKVLDEQSTDLFKLSLAIALGMFAETMVLGILHYFGISIFIGFIVFALIGVGITIYNWKIRKSGWLWTDELLHNRPTIWESIIAILIIEKIAWSIYNLAYLPVYFDDALNHWAGRGKALLTGTNWSWDPESAYFMGKAFGHMEYPLFASIWRAVNAALLGIQRIDGFILSLVMAVTAIYWIFQKTNKRWLGLLSGYIILAMPLEAWHMSAGYAEIFIQAYLLITLWCIMNDRFLLAGLFSAAMIWSKNEGLILFVPCVIACLVIKLLLDNKKPIRDKLSAFVTYNISWVLAISPWLAFKLLNGVGLTIPGNSNIGYVEGALAKMATALFNSPSSSILWIFLVIGMIISIPRILKSRTLLPLAVACLILLAMMTFVFTSTNAYIFLENEMTIHRSLMQIAPAFIILVVMALGQNQLTSPTKEGPLLKVD